MRKKTRNEVDEERAKAKGMKMKDELHDLDDMCESDDLVEDIDHNMDMCDMAGLECRPDMDGDLPDCIMLAHSYVPWQYYEKAFTPSEALVKGTLFPELWGAYAIPK
ncbi:spore coat associated protein CotJA [Sporomusa termitida]|uniref:Spore coat associated protein JA (CotJA) n=1 Tax=Sporomusa termitida TaxID=2377 RepID=A0A517E087_9FIRM|nr:spore coat associated protein CotJA [Sporomusa termitida]QDR83017.1 Spore coat associated protein JA (CotJA) [Sporomusa termitida]